MRRRVSERRIATPTCQHMLPTTPTRQHILPTMLMCQHMLPTMLMCRHVMPHCTNAPNLSYVWIGARDL